MKLQTYVQNNWEKLPKSSFDGDEMVIVEVKEDEDYGWGHHSYEAFGIDKEGKSYWVFSSGCSCNGSVNTEHSDDKTLKVFELEKEYKKADWDKFDFYSLQTTKDSY